MAMGEVTPGTARAPSGDVSAPKQVPESGSPRPAHPPRPSWGDFWELRRVFGANLLEGLTLIHRRYGAFVRTRLPLQLYFVADPTCIEEILVKKADQFRKDRTSRLLARVVGNGLLVNEGASWRRQRRLLQPAFHQRQLASYAAVMVGAIERAAATWQAGQVRNVHEDMMGVTMNIVAETLFGTDVSADTGHIGRIISELMEEFGRILGLAARYQPPAWVPTRANRRLRASTRKVDETILRIIEARRRQQNGQDSQRTDGQDDLLSLLIRARDEDGSVMTDAQVRDEAMTLFLAGHETTALALTYSLYLLANNPQCQARLCDELQRVLGGRAPGLGDLENLKYTDAVVLEAMRLFPPAWALGRQALTDVEIGGYQFRKGAEFVMSPWVVHRDPKTFDDPEAFKPQRWDNDLAHRLPRFAYFPFGGGPRVCIGNRFAMMEAKLVLAVALQRFRFEVAPETALTLFPSVTLRPRHGVRLRLRQGS
ncbi:MAG TPA: cytochrome P450 [Polyangia bacterium]|nr:cytochrome P450 [Polyangia bacterium]